jgi:NitT/TauT family transport system ATP-binding protein
VLTFKQVNKSYVGKARQLIALDGLSFSVPSGRSFAMIGPSGCGKSTALLLAAGLLKPNSGEVLIGDQPILHPRRQTALILQDFGLLPWKTVFENATLGLRVRACAKEERIVRTHQALQQVGLEQFAAAYPSELSGGMRQRLALARALALDVDVMLMDEPLSALDLGLRESLQDLLLALWRRRGYTQLLVTHSIEEAIFLGQQVLVISPRPGHVATIIDNPEAGEANYRNSTLFAARCRELRKALLSQSGRDGAFNRTRDADNSEAVTDIHSGKDTNCDA